VPRRAFGRSRLWTSSRYLLLGVVLAIGFVVIFGRAVARFYVDELWFDALGQSGVFWTVLRAKLVLFGLFFGLFGLLAGINLGVADQLAPTRFPVNVHPFVERFHDLFGRRLRFYRYLLAALIGIVVALPASSRWQDWLLYRNARSFDRADPQFGVDVGFYVFELPFLSFIVDWLFVAMIAVLVITLLTHVLNGGVLFASPVPTVSPAMKGHVAVLLAVLAAVKAADYWIRRYESTNSNRGFVQGPTYSVVHAQLPALLLLSVVAIVTAGLYLSTLRTQSWRIPLVASAIWLVLAIAGGYIYPAAIQSLVVRPNQKAREATSIANNVNATIEAMGLTEATLRQVPLEVGDLAAADIERDTRPLETVRLLNPIEALARFQRSQGQVAGLTIDDLDIDREDVDGDGLREQVIIAGRELDVSGAANQSWQGRHLINTHGCGLVRASASSVRPNGEPEFEQVELSRPELYFSPSLSGWAVAGSAETETGCGNDQYRGTSGVDLSSWWRRAAFALAFMDYNLIGSGAIGDGAQMLWNRNVHDRVSKLAPFLSFDGDPYPVVVDGRAVWVVDAYTSTSRYPAAEAVGHDVALTPGSGIPRSANYLRNSVKATVDAYDGTVRFYVVEPDDPIVQAWWSAFPELFTPLEEMPVEMRAHLRYPEDLFRVQTNVYSKYQLAPEDFFDRRGAWSVAQAPALGSRDDGITAADPAVMGTPTELATEAGGSRFVPYYTLFDGGRTNPGGTGAGGEEFVIVRPFVPFSRNDERTRLQAFMTASSDWETYGELTVYVFDGELPPGPRDVAQAIQSEAEINEQITLLTQERSLVRFGDLQLVPIASASDGTTGLLWVRPFYVAVQLESGPVASVTDLEYIVVVHDNEAAMATTLSGALDQLFPGIDVEVADRIGPAGPPNPQIDPGEPGEIANGSSGAPGDPAPTATTVPVGVPMQVFELLNAADEALANGELGEYQRLVDEATGLLGEYLGTTPAESVPAAGSEPAGTAPPGG